MDKAEKTYDLADVFKIFPSCLSDRNLLKTVLLDVFPTDRVYVNLLLVCYDEEIINEISSGDCASLDMDQYINRLCDSIGCTKEISKRIITDLFYSFGYIEYNDDYDVIGSVSTGTVESEECYKNLKIKKVIIPEGVKRIGREAFSDCINLEEIVLPDGLEEIGDSVFSGCERLKEIHIPDSVKKIGAYAFENCTNLISVVLPCSIDTICEGMFLNCQKLKKVIIPDTVVEICDYAFYECRSLKVIYFPQSVYKIGKCAFYCDGEGGLISISSVYDIEVIGDDAFSNYVNVDRLLISNSFFDSKEYGEILLCDNYKIHIDLIIIEEGVIRIPKGYFNGISCEKIILPDSLVEIGDEAFEYADFAEIIIPNGVEKIGSKAFHSSKIVNLKLPGTINYIGEYAFDSCEYLEMVFIDEGVKEIGDYAFDDCVNLKDIHLPNTLERIGKDTFKCCYQLKHLYIPEYVVKEKMFYSEPGWSKNGQFRIYNDILVDVDFDTNDFDIYSPVKGIDTEIFKNNDIHNIKINNCFDIIEESYFKKCEFTSIEFINPITEIKSMAFYGCENLHRICIPEGLKIIGYKAFYKCWKLEYIKLPNSIKRIEKYAFVLSGIKSVILPKTIEYVDENAFEPEVTIIFQ